MDRPDVKYENMTKATTELQEALPDQVMNFTTSATHRFQDYFCSFTCYVCIYLKQPARTESFPIRKFASLMFHITSTQHQKHFFWRATFGDLPKRIDKFCLLKMHRTHNPTYTYTF